MCLHLFLLPWTYNIANTSHAYNWSIAESDIFWIQCTYTINAKISYARRLTVDKCTQNVAHHWSCAVSWDECTVVIQLRSRVSGLLGDPFRCTVGSVLHAGVTGRSTAASRCQQGLVCHFWYNHIIIIIIIIIIINMWSYRTEMFKLVWNSHLHCSVRWQNKTGYCYPVLLVFDKVDCFPPYLFAVYVDDLIRSLRVSGYGLYIGQLFAGCLSVVCWRLSSNVTIMLWS